MENKSQQKDEEVRITFAQLLKSTLAAFFGVQNSKNRERDFKHGKVSHFIAIGLLFGLLFIATIVTVVQIVMHFAAN